MRLSYVVLHAPPRPASQRPNAQAIPANGV
jgi:hypothetical protein